MSGISSLGVMMGGFPMSPVNWAVVFDLSRVVIMFKMQSWCIYVVSLSKESELLETSTSPGGLPSEYRFCDDDGGEVRRETGEDGVVEGVRVETGDKEQDSAVGFQ
jgi:hypothetical protein